MGFDELRKFLEKEFSEYPKAQKEKPPKERWLPNGGSDVGLVDWLKNALAQEKPPTKGVVINPKTKEIEGGLGFGKTDHPGAELTESPFQKQDKASWSNGMFYGVDVQGNRTNERGVPVPAKSERERDMDLIYSAKTPAARSVFMHSFFKKWLSSDEDNEDPRTQVLRYQEFKKDPQSFLNRIKRPPITVEPNQTLLDFLTKV